MTTVYLLKMYDFAWLISDGKSSYLLGKVVQVAPGIWEAKHLPPVGPYITKMGATRDEAFHLLAKTLGWTVTP